MVPSTLAQLTMRVEELRTQAAPFLESRPKPLEARRRQDLCGDDWRFKSEFRSTERRKPLAVPEAPPWQEPGHDVSGWETARVPEWRYEVLGWNHGPSSIVWYRKAFTAGKPQPGERVFLVFEGVDWDAEVWLNGNRLGRNNVVFEPFRFEVTGVLEQDNTLAVRIVDGPSFGEPTAFASVFMTPNASVTRYDRNRSQSLAGLKNGDNHIGNGFGIYRPVYLETTQGAMIREVQSRGYPERDVAVVQVEMDVTGAAPAAVKVELLPENFEGESFVKLIDLGRGSATPARQRVSVPMPGARLWSPAMPYLYRCRVSLVGAEGQRLDAQDVLFGYRSFSMVSELAPREGLQPGTLLLNGKPVFLRGTCIQGENALAMWGDKETLIDIFLMLKASNMNALRSIQHVQFPEIRELLDRLGILSQQDAGDSQLSSGLPTSAAALARVCYNNPGVVLLSFANETEFNPAVPLSSALAVDPERIFVPISGRRTRRVPGQKRSDEAHYPDNKDAWAKLLSPEVRAQVLDSFHPYWGWYPEKAQLANWCRPLGPDRMLQVGEYGSEALDGYETMKRYPESFGTLPPKEADTLWGHVQVVKADARQVVGLRGRKPTTLAEYIAASQNYQYDQLAELTKAWRISPRRIAATFQYHFIDVLPANWPKAVVSHDLTPKRAYFAMAQVNQPLVPLFRLLPGGKSMELWVANDLAQVYPGCTVRWSVGKGPSAARGEQKADVPASDAVMAGVAEFKDLPADLTVADVELVLENKDGVRIGSYRQEVYLAAWKQKKASIEKPAEGGGEAILAPHAAAAGQENVAEIKSEVKSYASFQEMVSDPKPVLPPVRAVTTGPVFHWFGYYDKFQTDPTDRYLLCMQVDFENRLPKSNEPIKIGMIDLQNNNRWIELGESQAWCWQMGCMLQWRPGSQNEVVWNDREGDRFVSRVLDVKTRKLRTLPMPVGAITPDGRTAVCEDFSRMWHFRPGYAYAGIPDRYASESAPAATGLWRMDMESGESRLLISLADLANPVEPGKRYYVNHAAWNVDGTRLLMYLRDQSMRTRVYTIAADGGEPRLIVGDKHISHWAWRDPGHVVFAITQNSLPGTEFQLFPDDGTAKPVETLWQAKVAKGETAWLTGGHQSPVPGTQNEWWVCDTYPMGQAQEQILYLVHVPSKRFYLLGRFALPSQYKGEWRSDLHPRLSRDGRLVIIDSPYAGNGRQQYIVDISKIVSTKIAQP